MAQGRVRVNGEIASAPGTKVDPDSDRVELDGRTVRLQLRRWIALNKPRGVLTTRKDTHGRPTVYGLLPEGAGGLRYVGRLDRGTEGLLLFTNEGDAAHALLHPSSEIPREYRARVRGVPSSETLRRLETGVDLDDGPARAERVRVLRTPEKPARGERIPGKRTSEGRAPGRPARDKDSAVVALVLREGRKREVRRMLEAVGHPVLRLRRVRFGPLRLGDLPPGEWRELTSDEMRELRRIAGMEGT